ncbi:MAG TPA: PLP-dependent aminotransferase family protein [bacterium]|nr:PLP-dependent aminotransferase family protein [bacterium]HPN45024.1 PLP-dependent aminotransferase family protein [bacterium]
MENVTDLFAPRLLKVQKSFIREILKVAANPEIISFAGGLPNPDVFPVREIQISCDEVLRRDGYEALQYSTTEGYLPLREYIAAEYNAGYDLHIKPENILITNGSQQGLDLISKVFIDKDDKVLIEKPGYLGAIQALSIYQPEFIGITLNNDGVAPQELAEILNNNAIKLFYTVPNFQNPSGVTYSYNVREKVAAQVAKHNIILVEDNPYGALRFSGSDQPPFRKWLGPQSIMLGTFSKTVVPSFRLGWICADHDIMEKALVAKQGADLHTNYFCQKVVHYFLTHFDMQAHIEKTKQAYKKQCDAMIGAIENYFPKGVTFTKPEGGMFIWVTLPRKIPSLKLLELALQDKVAFVPGNPFYIDGGGGNSLRLNYSNSNPDQIEIGIKKLALAMKKLMEE